LIRYDRACFSYQDFLLKSSVTSKVLRSPSWLVWPLRNICITDDHRSSPFVVHPSFKWGSCFSVFGFLCCFVDLVSLVLSFFILDMLVLSFFRFMFFLLLPWYLQTFFSHDINGPFSRFHVRQNYNVFILSASLLLKYY
jgi:hypothetical protein